MRMLSAPVLVGAVLASSPALYQGFVTHTVPVELAGTRFAVALVIAWVAMSAVAMLVGDPPAPEVLPQEEEEPATPIGSAHVTPPAPGAPTTDTPQAA